MISDFIDSKSFQTDLTIANRRHDVIAIQVYDNRETELPSIGLMRVKDAETGAERQIDTSSKAVRKVYNQWWINQQNSLNESFKKSNIDSVSISTNQDYVKALMGLFNLRS